ncbi:hypothetical protein C8Q72DRAFT_897548, partial [Fomitopsis betulina]
SNFCVHQASQLTNQGHTNSPSLSPISYLFIPLPRHKSMAPEQAFVLVYIHYRLDGNKATYLKSLRSNDCKFFVNVASRDASFLQLPGAGWITTLESWEEAKVCCRWPVTDPFEASPDELIRGIHDQIKFLQKSESAEFEKSLEISKIELVLPEPLSVDKRKILQLRDLFAQHKAAKAGTRTKGDALEEKARFLRDKQLRLTNEISSMSSWSHSH